MRLGRTGAFFASLTFLVSCERKEESSLRLDLETSNEKLRDEAAEQAGIIEVLEAKLKKSDAENEAIASIQRNAIAMIHSRLEVLDEEVSGAHKTLEEIRLGIEKVKRLQAERDLKIERGEKIEPLFCAHGPWEQWPKETKDAEDLIVRNARKGTELRKVLAVLSPFANEKERKDQVPVLKGDDGE